MLNKYLDLLRKAVDTFGNLGETAAGKIILLL